MKQPVRGDLLIPYLLRKTLELLLVYTSTTDVQKCTVARKLVFTERINRKKKKTHEATSVIEFARMISPSLQVWGTGKNKVG